MEFHESQNNKQSNRQTIKMHFACGLWYSVVGMHRNNRETKSASLKLQLMTVFVATGAEFGVDS